MSPQALASQVINLFFFTGHRVMVDAARLAINTL